MDYSEISIAGLKLLKALLAPDGIQISYVEAMEEIEARTEPTKIEPGTIVILPGPSILTVSLTVEIDIDHLKAVEKRNNDFIAAAQRNPHHFRPATWGLRL